MRKNLRAQKMVEEQLIPRGITNRQVLQAMAQLPREEFVPKSEKGNAYLDGPLPIGYGQTISEPYIVALMTELLSLTGKKKVLEIGTGSGYQAAILSRLAKAVYTIEREPKLIRRAEKTFLKLGFKNIRVFEKDGSLGLPEFAPYEAIIVTCAAPNVPSPLFSQLKEGGRLVLPLGDRLSQELTRITKRKGEMVRENFGACRFVPLVGQYGFTP